MNIEQSFASAADCYVEEETAAQNMVVFILLHLSIN